jgi:O-methyltransferase involved in polyketide biosynthesis
MNRLAVARLLRKITKAYPNAQKLDDEETVDIWASFFAKERDREVYAAAAKHIETSKFPPTIAELKAFLPKRRMDFDTEAYCRNLDRLLAEWGEPEALALLGENTP